jgi:predicted small lipoprotein YifL
MMRRRLLGLLLLAPALVACGRKGDLRLPDRPPAAPVPAAPIEESSQDPAT